MDEVVSWSATGACTTGSGDTPSPTTAIGLSKLSELAPLIEQRPPATMRAARVANIIFLRCFTMPPIAIPGSDTDVSSLAWLTYCLNRSNITVIESPTAQFFYD